MPPHAIPANVRRAGALVALEGAIAVVTAIVLIIRALMGHDDQQEISGYGTAAWFVIIGGAVLAGGLALLFGRRWGRAIAVIAQILLIPLAYALFTSDLPLIGIPVALIVAAVLILLFSPSSLRWLSESYADPEIVDPDDQRPA